MGGWQVLPCHCCDVPGLWGEVGDVQGRGKRVGRVKQAPSIGLDLGLQGRPGSKKAIQPLVLRRCLQGADHVCREHPPRYRHGCAPVGDAFAVHPNRVARGDGDQRQVVGSGQVELNCCVRPKAVPSDTRFSRARFIKNNILWLLSKVNSEDRAEPSVGSHKAPPEGLGSEATGPMLLLCAEEGPQPVWICTAGPSVDVP